MSPNTWTPTAVWSEAREWRGVTWRLVEAQHVATTMKIVDTLEEQEVLEVLLERSKPLIPNVANKLDYLLSTPFRYPPRRQGSRFRAVTDPGVFYGAASARTACAELGYWRWRFLTDAHDLKGLGPVAHTAFAVQIKTLVIDLREPPFVRNQEAWLAANDYSATQQLGQVARTADIGAILYQSVRDPQPSWCMALLTPLGFAKNKPQRSTQTWLLTVHQREVIWHHEKQSLVFSMIPWVN